MSLLTALAGRLASVAMVGPAIARFKRRAVQVAVGGALVAVLGGLGLAYLLIALRHELERHLGPVWTPAAIGAALLVFAGIAYLAFLRPPRSAAEEAESRTEAVRENFVSPARQVEQQITQRPLASVAAAVAVGFAVASLLRSFRGRSRRDGGGEAAPRASRRPDPVPDWTREVVFREADRRKGNGAARP